MSGVRLRQVALVARELEPVVAAARRELELEEDPFSDPGISVFGLHNAVMAVGDTFLEVVSPVQEGTTAGRYLERRGGDGGYMAIFQVEDLAAARARIDALGIRVVWRSDQSDIAGTHLHPRDVPGALVSIDWASPPESWRWAGPSWTGGAPTHRRGGITAVTVQTAQPRELAAQWGAVLGRESLEVEGGAAIALDGGEVRFVPERDGRGEGICEIEVNVPGGWERRCALGGINVVIGPIGG